MIHDTPHSCHYGNQYEGGGCGIKDVHSTPPWSRQISFCINIPSCLLLSSAMPLSSCCCCCISFKSKHHLRNADRPIIIMHPSRNQAPVITAQHHYWSSIPFAVEDALLTTIPHGFFNTPFIQKHLQITNTASKPRITSQRTQVCHMEIHRWSRGVGESTVCNGCGVSC